MNVITANVNDGETVELPSNVETVDFSARRRGVGFLLFMCAQAPSDARYGTTEYRVTVHDLGTKADRIEVDTDDAAITQAVNVQRNHWLVVELMEVGE